MPRIPPTSMERILTTFLTARLSHTPPLSLRTRRKLPAIKRKQISERSDRRYFDTGSVVLLVTTPFWLMTTGKLPVEAVVGTAKST